MITASEGMRGLVVLISYTRPCRDSAERLTLRLKGERKFCDCGSHYHHTMTLEVGESTTFNGMTGEELAFAECVDCGMLFIKFNEPF